LDQGKHHAILNISKSRNRPAEAQREVMISGKKTVDTHDPRGLKLCEKVNEGDKIVRKERPAKLKKGQTNPEPLLMCPSLAGKKDITHLGSSKIKRKSRELDEKRGGGRPKNPY